MAVTGRCHCGRSRFEIEGEIPPSLTRCTCSYCSTHGVLWAYYRPEQFRLASSPDDLAAYRWKSKLVAHKHCPVCACHVYSDSPAFERDGSWDGRTRRYGVNARLFADFDAAAAPVMVIDGKNLW